MAETNQQNNDTSFLDEKKGPKLHIKDVLFIVLRNAHWLLLCGAVGALVAGYSVRHQNRVYESNAQLLIKGSTTGSSENSVREASVRSMFSTKSLFNSNINNEIQILTSKNALTDVATNLKLNIRYTAKTKIVNRVKDLYGESPIEVTFVDVNPEDWVALEVTPIDDNTCRLAFDGYEPQDETYGDTVATPTGRIVVTRTWFMTPSYYGTAINVSHAAMSATAEQYRGALSVVRNDDFNSIINISLHDASPIRAADVINEAIRVYNEDFIRDKQRIIAYTYDYINQRLQMLQSDLGIQENALAGIKREHNLLDLSNFGQSYLATSIESSEEIERLKKQLNMARYLVETNESSRTPQIIPANIGLDDQAIMEMIAKHNALVLEIENFGDNVNNPTVKAKQNELDKLRYNMNRMLDVYMGVLQERVSDAQIVASKASSKMSQVPQQQLYIENLERLQKIKEELYLHLLSRREELMISQPSIEPNGKILSPARINRTPIAPNEKRSTLMGLLLGLMVPVAVFFLRRLLDTKVKYHNDVIAATNAPFLCEIPERSKDDDRNLIVTSHDHDSMSESFRLLRAKVDFLGSDASMQGKGRVMMITSLLPAMGKTFISSNLAASFGIAGKRVIILDLDLRKGSLTREFYSRRHAGLSNYLTDKTDNWENLVKKDLITNGVDAIFTGPIPPNPSELLGNGHIEALVAKLRQTYDYIILDTAPVGFVVDTDIIKKIVDNTIFVIRANHFDKRMMENVDKMYVDHEFPNMAIVLNDVHYRKLMPFERKYGYGYGYGYGSVYGNNPSAFEIKEDKNAD